MQPEARRLHTRGLKANKDGRIHEAADCFIKAAALQPDHSAILISAGNMLLKLGEWPYAIALYERALGLPTLGAKEAAMVQSKLLAAQCGEAKAAQTAQVAAEDTTRAREGNARTEAAARVKAAEEAAAGAARVKAEEEAAAAEAPRVTVVEVVAARVKAVEAAARVKAEEEESIRAARLKVEEAVAAAEAARVTVAEGEAAMAAARATRGGRVGRGGGITAEAEAEAMRMLEKAEAQVESTAEDTAEVDSDEATTRRTEEERADLVRAAYALRTTHIYACIRRRRGGDRLAQSGDADGYCQDA